MKKNAPFFMPAMLLLSVFFSCTKNIKEVSAATASSATHAAATMRNPYGILVSESSGYIMPDSEQVHLANDLGVAYGRISVSNLQWDSDKSRNKFLAQYKAYTTGAKPMGVLLNVNWGSRSTGSVPFPGATDEYKKYIKDVTDTLTSAGYVKPTLIVLENEENNPNYHAIYSTDDQARYIDQLKFAITECHSKNLMICNGGMTHLGIILLVWDYYKNIKHDNARANKFVHDCLPNYTIQTFLSDRNFYENKLSIAKYYITAYKDLDLDFVNMHWYEPLKVVYALQPASVENLDTAHINPACIQSVYDYFNDPQTVNNIPLMCNEAGQVTPAIEIPQEVTCVMKNLPFVVWYDGDAAEIVNERPYHQVALHTTLPDGSPRYIIRPNGYAFRDNIANIIADPNYCDLILKKGE